MSNLRSRDHSDGSLPEHGTIKDDASPIAVGPSVTSETNDQVYFSRKRRTPRPVRMHAASPAAFAAMGPSMHRALAAVFKALSRTVLPGVCDFELFAPLPDGDQNTLRPARNKLDADAFIVTTSHRRRSKAGCESVVWKLAAFSDGVTVGSTATTHSCSTPEEPEQRRQPRPPYQLALLDSVRACTLNSAPQATERSEPDAAGGAP